MKIEFKHYSVDFGRRHEVIAKVTTADGSVHRLCADLSVWEIDEIKGIEAREGDDWERRRLVKYKRLARKRLRATAAERFADPA